MMTTLAPPLAAGDNGANGQFAPCQAEFWFPTQEFGTLAPKDTGVPRIAVVDDDEELHAFVKDLGDLGHFELTGSFRTAAQALECLSKDPPHAVIMDIRLPDMSGIECTIKLKTILPELQIVVLTGYPDSRNVLRALMQGASGFLIKPVTTRELLDAIADVLKGEFALSRQAVPFLMPVFHQLRQLTKANRLTLREEEILACLFQGMQDKEIASTLRIGTATVHTHMHRLFEKLGVHSRRELVVKYLDIS
jgi:DNA-binding NarL/FixJ family response regulator